ncbi:hypothetical protein GGI11_008124, partial [Coemansia sp. RSA 2049]
QQQQQQLLQQQQSRQDVTTAWSVAKPVGESFLPSATGGTSASDSMAGPNQHARADAPVLTPMPSGVITPDPASANQQPRTYARLKTTADIAAAMDAAAAGDKNALRAIQATGMLSDLDDTPTEPADPRVEFSTHGLEGPDQPLSQQQQQQQQYYCANDSVQRSPSAMMLASEQQYQQPKSQVQLSQSVRDRLIKARIKQKQKQQKQRQKQKQDQQEEEEQDQPDPSSEHQEKS